MPNTIPAKQHNKAKIIANRIHCLDSKSNSDYGGSPVFPVIQLTTQSLENWRLTETNLLFATSINLLSWYLQLNTQTLNVFKYCSIYCKNWYLRGTEDLRQSNLDAAGI